jgi:hypothetical protein
MPVKQEKGTDIPLPSWDEKAIDELIDFYSPGKPLTVRDLRDKSPFYLLEEALADRIIKLSHPERRVLGIKDRGEWSRVIKGLSTGQFLTWARVLQMSQGSGRYEELKALSPYKDMGVVFATSGDPQIFESDEDDGSVWFLSRDSINCGASFGPLEVALVILPE